MKRFIDDADVQIEACWVFQDIAAVDTCLVTIGDVGGVEAIINAMKHHPNNDDMQHNALEALVLLSRNEDNNIKVGAAGSVNAIVETINEYPVTVDKQGKDRGLPFNLDCKSMFAVSVFIPTNGQVKDAYQNGSNSRRHSITIADARGIESILNAIERHSYIERNLLAQLSENDENSITIINMTNGIKVFLIKAVKLL